MKRSVIAPVAFALVMLELALIPSPEYNDARLIGTHVREELEAVDWACDDTIIFYTQVMRNSGSGDVDLTYTFDAHEGSDQAWGPGTHYPHTV